MADIRSVDHVQLPVPPGSSARTRGFYEGLLGLGEVRSPALDRPGTLRYALGWQCLDLTEGLYTGIAPQAHRALRVGGLGPVALRLCTAGLRVEDAPLVDADRICVEDPFGNRRELVETTAEKRIEHVSRFQLAV